MNDRVALPPMDPADIDPIDRLAILAAALPGAAVRQRRIAAPFDAVWQVIADLEHATPRYEPGVAQVRVIEQRGEFLRLLVQDTAGREDAMDARLRPGWCRRCNPPPSLSPSPPAASAARPCSRISNTGARRTRRPAEAGRTTTAPPWRKSTRSSEPSKGSLPAMGAERHPRSGQAE